STILSKLKDISSKQKSNIKSSLETQGELPFVFQIAVAIIFWGFLFVILLVTWNPSSRWIIILIAIVGAYGAIELVNLISKKYIKKDLDEETADLEAIEEEILSLKENKISFTQNSILLGELYSKGGVILGKPHRTKYNLTPVIVLAIDSVASGSSSIFSSISASSLQKISLKYNCSVIDTSHYEVIMLIGDNKNCRATAIRTTINKFSESFFHEAFDLITELQRDKRIEFEKPSKEILQELFPHHKNIVSLEPVPQISTEIEDESDLETKMENSIELNQVAEIIEEEKTPRILVENEEEEEIIVEAIVDEESESPKEEIIEISKTSTDKKMLKEVLLTELDYSLENFLSASKNYYKKALENILQKSYGIKLDKFLKLVLYFCDKEDIPFFFPSYSYLMKIIEFIDVELPSSTDIENYIDKLTEDYASVKIPKKIREKLVVFLDKKYSNGSSTTTSSTDQDNTKMSSIPAPPTKDEANLISDGGE
ncbi:MAG: hypothetical protein ACTSO3_15815, partial [Candidatus Heimdallarchaeaceae archaeon]